MMDWLYSSWASLLSVLLVAAAVAAPPLISEWLKARRRVDDADFAEFVLERSSNLWVTFEDEFGDTIVTFKHSITTIIHDMTLAPDRDYCFLVRADSQKWMVDAKNAELIAKAIGAPSPVPPSSGEIPTVQLTDTPRNAGDIPF